MTNRILFCALAVLLSFSALSDACVGRTLHIGVTSASNERLLAELASLIISERTGSTVQIDVYQNSTELYNSLKKGNVNLFFESAAKAADLVGKPKDATYSQLKNEYRVKFNMTWLDQIGDSAIYAPVLTSETVSSYPALPKLLNKLSAALGNNTYSKLASTVESPDKAKKIAKDFLKGKKLI